MSTLLQKTKDKIFTSVHSNNLIYNTCWEDPRIDRRILDLDQNSKIVMITSAGCNALDYTLDNVASIDCIDLNFRQNAVLELKLALFANGDFELLFDLFGSGKKEDVFEIYCNQLRKHLSKDAISFWDKAIHHFEAESNKKSFYFRGTSGSFAWLFNKYLSSKPKARKLALALLECKSLEEQRAVYTELEPKIMGNFVKWMVNRQMTMNLLGVPDAQRELIASRYPNGMAGFIQDNLKHIFTELPIFDNYFWRLYITGSYTKECSPNYLKEDNFEFIKNTHKIKTHTTSIAEFLKENPGDYTHFILLDHQDWMANNRPDLLDEEWELILKNSAPNAKYLLRSAAAEIDFLPSYVTETVDFNKHAAEVNKQHKFDRVGTYGCTLLGELKTQ